MKNAKRQAKVQAIINQAIADGKLSAVVEPVWRAIGMNSIDTLKDLVSRTPRNPALSSDQGVTESPLSKIDLILIQASGSIENIFSPLMDRVMAMSATIETSREFALNSKVEDLVMWPRMMDALDFIQPDLEFLDAMVNQLNGLLKYTLSQVTQRPATAAEVPPTPPASAPRKRDKLAANAFQTEGVGA